MSHPSAIFPNEIYLNGLRDADAAVIESLYNEFRQGIVRAVETAGGSYADGAAFFKAAVIQTTLMAQSGTYPGETPIFLWLKNLAIAHYRGWLFEKGQDLPPKPEHAEEEIGIIKQLPSDEAMQELRTMVTSRRQFSRLPPQDQTQILQVAAGLVERGDESGFAVKQTQKSSLDLYKKLLEKNLKTWEVPMPVATSKALTNPAFSQIWSICEGMERRLSASQIPERGDNRTIKYAFLAFLFLTVGYAVFSWVFRDRTPAEVYDNNFDPPASIVEDLKARYSQDSVPVNRPEACNMAFERADAHYRRKAWREAATELAEMMDASYAVCQSDALFYLSIIGLQLDRPELTLECIAKMEDLERYGEEIYWYMALAYVKIAANDPSEKDIALRAVQRALSNTEIPERRVQAEKMLKDLSE